ncbi:MAG: protein translocase subunit SecD [Eubacteriales bacterium]
MKKNKGILSLVLVVACIILLGYTAVYGWGNDGFGSASNMTLGLDLNGGVSITYQTVESNPSSADMSDTIYKLQKRVEDYSTESTVYQVGDDRISIEIPGATNANDILEELGQPGSLEFQDSTGTVVLSGTDIANAEAGTQQDSVTGAVEYVVKLTMTDEGTTKFAEATAANVGSYISIIYDGETISSPTVSEAITGGTATISGMESYEAAETLASTIRIGGLNLELEEIESNVVGATLGEEALESSIKAGAIGLAIIFIFMCVVYLVPGLASCIALLVYIGLVIFLINAFEITLTLPGIAGIILGIGMAVDANVIIFARVKEELISGKVTRVAVRIGFKKALSAIVDGNITTLIAAVVLAILGSGTVKGFAYTLALGIVVSMFSSLVVTRLIVNAFVAVGIKKPSLYGANKKASKSFDFLKVKNLCFITSAVVILVGFVAIGINAGSGNGAFDYALEFSGGTSTTIEFNEEYSLAEIEELVQPIVSEVTGDNNIQASKVQDSTQVIVKTRTLDLEERTALSDALVETFAIEETAITAESISATVSTEMRSDAILAVIVATICMLLYIWFRFKDVRFAGSAVIALIHDVLIVLAFYAVARVSVGNTFIACMLTIVGYSINATIVIFDRIREEVKYAPKKEELYDIVNRSISNTLTRSIYTSFTTFVMVAVLYILGVSAIREFALPLMVGIICGAYSSVCITGALWYTMKKKIVSK